MILDLAIDELSVFLDVDGTLIDIAARPDDVVVPKSLIKSLDVLSERLGGAVALVSGRAISDLDRLFEPLRLRAAGVHGAEMRADADGDIVSSAANALSHHAVGALHALAEAFPGTLVEDKRYSVAIHFRGAPTIGVPLRDALDHFMQSQDGHGLGILPGHMVFEIKRANFDKGEAIDTFMRRQPFEGRCPIFLGDDVTDRPGFEAVLARGGYAFSVGQVLPGLSGSLPDPAAVRDWLADLADRRSRSG